VQAQRLCQRLEGVSRPLLQEPAPVHRRDVTHRIHGLVGIVVPPAVTAVAGPRFVLSPPRLGIGPAVIEVLAILRHPGVEIDQVRQPLRNAVSHPGDDHPPVAPADEHDILQVFVLEDVDDVDDVGVKIDVGVAKVDPLAETREGRRENIVPGSAQERRELFPALPAAAGALNQYECCHRTPPAVDHRTDDAQGNCAPSYTRGPPAKCSVAVNGSEEAQAEQSAGKVEQPLEEVHPPLVADAEAAAAE
jgi:hypothetical protein